MPKVGVPARTVRVTTRASTKRPSRRSEEHTSELQSRQYLVCRLLLEKTNSTQLTGFLLSPDPPMYTPPLSRRRCYCATSAFLPVSLFFVFEFGATSL